MCGVFVPTWLSQEPEKVFAKRHVRNKYDPLVDEVKLVQINPNHGVIRYPNRHESTVSIRDLASVGNETRLNEPEDLGEAEADHAQITDPNVVENTLPLSPNVETELQTPLQWRSSRARKAPDRLQHH